MLLAAAVAATLAITGGCGSSSGKSSGKRRAANDQQASAPRQRKLLKPAEVASPQRTDGPADATGRQPDRSHADPIDPRTGRPRSLGDLLDQPSYVAEKMPIDEQRLLANGIRKLTGKHLTLFTDLPASPAVDQLPQVFDLAVPQWCEYFEVPIDKVESWRMNGFLIKDKQRFVRSQVFPPNLPPFQWGYQRGHEFWLFEQPSDYYRRHLFLHEGTHGFMNWHLGGTGPMWYTEGTAELLGTHKWLDGKLTLRYNPRDRNEVEQWGRVKVIKDHFAKDKALTLDSIFFMRGQGQVPTEVYAWCWAVCSFFDQHPRWQRVFRDMRKHSKLTGDQFTMIFKRQLQEDWLQIGEQWQLYVSGMEYGYDVARADVLYRPGAPMPESGASVTVSAERGWQSSAIRVEKGVMYEISATGRYVVGDDPRPWPCEPGGVTIAYHDSHPLGMLMGAIRNDDNPLVDKTAALALPEPIGLRRTIRCQRTGTLYFRINESAANLGDNRGQLQVSITRAE